MRLTLVGARLLVVSILCFSLGNLCRAQFKATIQGTVSDPKGAVVSGAKVTVQDQSTGVSHKRVTGKWMAALAFLGLLRYL
jgi:hypothetical protein